MDGTLLFCSGKARLRCSTGKSLSKGEKDRELPRLPPFGKCLFIYIKNCCLVTEALAKTFPDKYYEEIDYFTQA
jgi:hypothetical protein